MNTTGRLVQFLSGTQCSGLRSDWSLRPKVPGRKRYVMPVPIDVTPDAFARKVMSEKGYAKVARRQ